MGVWIDTDMGFDDIVAILVVQHAGIPIDGVSLVFGNALLPQVVSNAGGAASAFSWDMPIWRGRDRPVLGETLTAVYALGASGIPTSGSMLPDAPDVTREGAFEAFCLWLEAAGLPKRVLALGPLTNLAALALARPDLASRIDEVIWMGGSLTSGNHTASAEFNAAADPEAAAIVLAQGLPLKMVDLDFCRRVTAAPCDVSPIRDAGGGNAGLIADLLEGFIGIGVSRGRPSMALYDAAAALAFVEPDAVVFQPARIEIELQGSLTRGRTVVEARAGRGAFNAHFATDIDAERARAAILTTLLAEAERS
jgi:purine nucleosidase